MKSIVTVLAGLFCFTFPASIWAQSEDVQGPAFAAECTDVETHAFRNDDREETTDGWTSDEKFFGDLKIIYEGGDTATIDGQQVGIGWVQPDLMIATDPGLAPNDVCAAVWSFAIHLSMETVVASEVHGCSRKGEEASISPFSDLAAKLGGRQESVKVRAIQYQCQFTK